MPKGGSMMRSTTYQQGTGGPGSGRKKIKRTRKLSAWDKHRKSVFIKHPLLSFKEKMKIASDTWKRS